MYLFCQVSVGPGAQSGILPSLPPDKFVPNPALAYEGCQTVQLFPDNLISLPVSF